MTTYSVDQFAPVEGRGSEWTGPDELGHCIGREGQTLQSFVDELNAPSAFASPVPSAVSAAQDRRALLNAGLLAPAKDAVE